MVIGGALLFVLVGAGVVVALALMMTVMYRAFSAGSGYGELARRFPAPYEPAGRRYDWQHAAVGAVRWRNAATLVFSPEGLYLALLPRMPLLGHPSVNRHPAVLIPWTEIKQMAPTKLYWQQAVTLTIGEPVVAKVTLMQPFLSLVTPYTTVRPPG
jgi:hypothetical protein